jgi:hypothetical protein
MFVLFAGKASLAVGLASARTMSLRAAARTGEFFGDLDRVHL